VRTQEILTLAHEQENVSDSDANAADKTNETPTFEEMSLAQRVLTAWVQNTLKGAFVVLLLLFAVSFLVALAFVYPAVALWLTLGVVSISILVGVALYLG
jgi:hypothetical protein